MSKLIMFSSLTPFAADPANEALKKLPELTGKHSNRVAYIPYTDDDFESYFSTVVVKDCYLRVLGIGYMDFFSGEEPSLDKYDAVWLPGGNTFEALWYLKASGIFDMLKKFKGVFIGTSAGSIMMTPTIKIAQFADENLRDSQDHEGLNLTNFEVKPHWNSWNTKKQVFRDYVELHRTVVYGIPEGSAIIVDGDKLTPFGEYEIIK